MDSPKKRVFYQMVYNDMCRGRRISSVVTLSISWRKCQQANTKLQDLYKDATPHLIWLTDATSNLWRKVSKSTDILAKEITTILERKYTTSVRNTNTTLRETILPLIATSLEKCYNYVIDSTPVVINKTVNYTNYASELLKTRVIPEMVNLTKSAAHECRETWIPALVTHSSIITSSFISYANSTLRETLSSTATILSSSLTPFYQTTSPSYLETITWILYLSLQQLAYTLLRFVVVNLYSILTGTQPWRSTRIALSIFTGVLITTIRLVGPVII
uniref:Uncharacterized protein n=1 Tax=Crane fly tombus-like virus 3 TaxID=2499250 RepID=A0A3S9W0K1_9TOMB|nr:hypothetical protein 1 [Crane fly tombus-like virus 3]